jgi:hypothetical protein
MIVCCHHNAGQSDSLLIANKSFEICQQFKYLETPVTNHSCIHEEIKIRLNQGMLAVFLFSHLSSCPLSKNLPVFCMGVKHGHLH